MKNVMTVGAALMLTTTAAFAGGLDRSGQGLGIIFEEGNAAELSFGSIMPSVSGTASPVLGGFESGSMASNYTQIGVGVKYQVQDNLSFSLIYDQPFGAAVDYSGAEAGYYTGAASADVSSASFTAVGRYHINPNFSVHTGVRQQTVQASVSKPTVPFGGYTIESEKSSALGYVVGAAYEKPEIALRVALTYNSKITHDITATETCGLGTCSGTPEVTSVDTPESINLDFQSGVAANTLVFGSVRYAKWTQFDFAPTGHAPLGSLQSYDNDTTSYTLGVGRKFNDQWSGALTLGYEAATGGFAGDLAPTDGNFSVGLGGTHTAEAFKVSGGVRYIMLGDADTENPVPAFAGTTGSEFRDNSAIAIGLKISTTF